MMALKAPASRLAGAALAAFLFASAAVALPPPSPSPPVFQDRPFGPKPAPTPPRPSIVQTEPGRPIPRAWIVGGATFGAIAAAALMFFAVRAWQMSRLFGRQYLFPKPERVALRLGGERSGGLMATARFRDEGQAAQAGSETKDA